MKRSNSKKPTMTSAFEPTLVVQTLLRVICGGLLVYASLDKLGDAAKFLKVIENYHVLPAELLPLAAVVIPWLEFFTGLSLATGYKWRGSALLFCLLMGIYTLALGWNLAHGTEMNCGCFSMDAQEKLTGWTVLRDSVFLAMGLFVLTAERTYASLDAKFAAKN
jgi:uncharacterized membrane protein YphA (DoxX/SURF4 family)